MILNVTRLRMVKNANRERHLPDYICIIYQRASCSFLSVNHQLILAWKEKLGRCAIPARKAGTDSSSIRESRTLPVMDVGGEDGLASDSRGSVKTRMSVMGVMSLHD